MANMHSNTLRKTLATRRAEIALALLCLFLFCWRLGDARLFDLDEGLYVSSARNMARSGDIVVPRLNSRPHDRPNERFVPFFEKPILIYWVGAASIRLFGESEGAARLPVALASLLATFAVAAAGWRWFGRRAGLLAGLVYATVPMTVLDARQMTTDALLVIWFLLAMIAFVEKRPILFWIACALAVLTKGIAGLVLPGLVLASFPLTVRFLAWRRGDLTSGPSPESVGKMRPSTPGGYPQSWGSRSASQRQVPPNLGVRGRFFTLPKRTGVGATSLLWGKRARIVSHSIGIVLFLCIVVPWHVAILRAGGRDLNGRTWVEEYLVRQHVGRFKGLDTHHNAPPPTYFVYFLVGFFPWACFVPFALSQRGTGSEIPFDRAGQDNAAEPPAELAATEEPDRPGTAAERSSKSDGEPSPKSDSGPSSGVRSEPSLETGREPSPIIAESEPAGASAEAVAVEPSEGFAAENAANTGMRASDIGVPPLSAAQKALRAKLTKQSEMRAGGGASISAERRARRDGDTARTPTLYLFLKCWFWTIFVFFSASTAKLPTYIVPLYPAAALLAGCWLDWQLAQKDRFRLSKGIRIGAYAAVWTSGLLALVALLTPVFTRNRAVMPADALRLMQWITVVLAAGCLVAYTSLRRKALSVDRLRAGILTLAFTMTLVVALIAGPGYAVANRWIFGPYQDLARVARQDGKRGIPVVYYGFGDRRPSMLFYARDYSPFERKETPLLPFLRPYLDPSRKFADIITLKSTFEKQLKPELDAAGWRSDKLAGRDSGIAVWYLLRVRPR